MTTLSAFTATSATSSTPLTTGFAPALAIANEFFLQPAEVEERHGAGHSYADLMIAFTLAKSSGRDVDDLLVRHKAGEGWGHLIGI